MMHGLTNVTLTNILQNLFGLTAESDC